jgi:hypothetical protein
MSRLSLSGDQLPEVAGKAIRKIQEYGDALRHGFTGTISAKR